MNKWFHTVLLAHAGNIDRHLKAQVDYLKAENEVLLSRLKCKVLTTPEEREKLLRFGLPLGNGIHDALTIVQPKTFMKWVHDAERAADGSAKPLRGRPRICESVHRLVVRLARENLNWGYTRIQGEMLKLDRRLGRSTVKRILKGEGIPDASNRANSTWHEFLERHKETLWASDFSCVPSLSFRGLIPIYFLFFIHVGSRRVFLAGCTQNPDAAWVEQQARNFCIHLEETHQRARYVIHDRDTKYTKKFDDILRTADSKPLKLPVRAPNLNGYAESWIGSLKRERLNHFLIFGVSHLRHLLREYVTHYNQERPHQSLQNTTVIPLPAARNGEIRCKSRLGGVLKHYYRDAA